MIGNPRVIFLDEPSTGLHQQDVVRLLGVLKSITARGDSIFLIEHDELFYKYSDYLIELGPGPGLAGGKIICSDYVHSLEKSAGSLREYKLNKAPSEVF